MKNVKILPKIFIRTFLALASIILLIHLSVFFIFPKIYLESRKDELAKKADEMTEMLTGKNLDYVTQSLDFYSKNSEIKAFLQQKSGDHAIEIGPDFKPDFGSENTSLIIEERMLPLDTGEERTVQFLFTTDVTREAKELSFGFLPYTLFVSFVFSIGVAFVYARAIKRQIGEIKEVTDHMMALDEGARLTVDTSDEVGELKGQINDLYETLLKTIDDVNVKNREIVRLEELKVDFFRGASHELKTPLASLKIILENMLYEIGKYKDRDTYIRRSIEIVDDLTRHISQILSASSMERLKNDEEWIPIDEVLGELIDQYALLANEKKIAITKDLSTESLYIGRTALKMILSNLLSNAVKYTDEGGSIHIAGDGHWFSIENSFLGKDEIDLGAFFEMPYDLKKENSNGLGLYIVKSLLTNYHVDYKIEKTQDGIRFAIRCADAMPEEQGKE